MTPIKLYMLVFPLFIAAIAAEAAYFRWVLHKDYGWRATLSNVVVALGRLVTEGALAAIVLAVYFAAYSARPLDIPMDNWISWVALFFAVDLAYYWLHRMSHEIRWMWAQHAVHHTQTLWTWAQGQIEIHGVPHD